MSARPFYQHPISAALEWGTPVPDTTETPGPVDEDAAALLGLTTKFYEQETDDAE